MAKIENVALFALCQTSSTAREAALCDELDAYCQKHGLETQSADELLYDLWAMQKWESGPRLAEIDRAVEWVSDFIIAWDAWAEFDHQVYKQRKEIFGACGSAMI